MTDQATRGTAYQGGTQAGHAGGHRKHYHHGKTPAAWAGSMTAMVGFVVGGIGMVLGPNWTLFWAGIAILVLSLIVTVVLRQLGYGQS